MLRGRLPEGHPALNAFRGLPIYRGKKLVGMNGHYWRMQGHQGRLYLGTWNWSVELQKLPRLDELLQHQYGFDLFVSDDGVHREQPSKDGFGDGFNYGVRIMASTPHGLFVGTANPYYGTEVWMGMIF